MPKQNDDQYSDEEARDRLIATLRGARIAGHKPMESLIKKKPRAKKAAKKVARKRITRHARED
jgi:hypothetical protein